MVICLHCQTQKLAKNNLQRKEEHLLSCPAFAASPLSTARDEHGRNLVEASIARRGARTKPGNMRERRRERLEGRVGGGEGRERVGEGRTEGQEGDLQSRVERILRGEQQAQSGYLDTLGAENETMAALLSSASAQRKRRLPDDFGEDPAPNLYNNNINNNNNNNNTVPYTTTPPASSDFSAYPSSGSGFKNAELYLDEHDFDFLCSAATSREQRFAALVERLARLVRVRDMR